MRSWHSSSASSPGSCARASRKNCRCCSGMCRPISSGAWRALRFAGAAGPPPPRWRTWLSTWGTNAPIACRATRASSSCAVSMRCARVSIAWLRASSCSAHGAAHRDGSRLPVKLRVLLRLIEIQRVLLRHRLDDYVRATHLYRPLRFVFFLSPGVWFERRRGESRAARLRSEEHTSELQSLAYLVCRLLLEKKKTRTHRPSSRLARVVAMAVAARVVA